MIRKREGVGVGKWEVEGRECKQNLTSTVQYDYTLHYSLLPFSNSLLKMNLRNQFSLLKSANGIINQIFKTFTIHSKYFPILIG